MKYAYTIIILAANCVHLNSQNLTIPERSIPIKHSDYSEWVLVYNDDIKTSKLENDKTYYWLKAKQIHTSKGGYEGNLLHGEYTALYQDNSLREKGTFYKGLKSGEWKMWYPNGEIKQITRWRKGKISGRITYYDAQGKLMKKENYRAGELHGSQIEYKDSIEVIRKFRNGTEIIRKPKKEKKLIVNSEEGVKEKREKGIRDKKSKPRKERKLKEQEKKEEEEKSKDKNEKSKTKVEKA